MYDPTDESQVTDWLAWMLHGSISHNHATMSVDPLSNFIDRSNQYIASVNAGVSVSFGCSDFYPLPTPRVLLAGEDDNSSD